MRVRLKCGLMWGSRLGVPYEKDPAAVGLELLGWILGHFVIFLLWVYKGPYIKTFFRCLKANPD